MNRYLSGVVRRPLIDQIEVYAPNFVALINRMALQLPAPLRRRLVEAAFDRAEAAFNRGDFEPICALFTANAEYVPPPALHNGQPIIGRAAMLQFWNDVLARYPKSSITNLSIQQATARQFVRTAKLSHEGPAEHLSYVIRQTTELRHGSIIRQINEAI
jgi:ketosteroid isomerase-like protein